MNPQSPSSPATAAGGAVEVSEADLHGHGVVFCPNPKMALWSTHPRVFLDIAASGEAKCPYCGTLYRLRAGAAALGAH